MAPLILVLVPNFIAISISDRINENINNRNQNENENEKNGNGGSENENENENENGNGNGNGNLTKSKNEFRKVVVRSKRKRSGGERTNKNKSKSKNKNPNPKSEPEWIDSVGLKLSIPSRPISSPSSIASSCSSIDRPLVCLYYLSAQFNTDSSFAMSPLSGDYLSHSHSLPLPSPCPIVSPRLVPSSLSLWMLSLTRCNMRNLYNRQIDPEWAWNEKKKRQELNDEAARFIVVYETQTNQARMKSTEPIAVDSAADSTSALELTNSLLLSSLTASSLGPGCNPSSVGSPSALLHAVTPVAFVHLRFLLECDVRVCYIYELQVESAYHQRGVGAALMKLVEETAAKWRIYKCVLTVLKENEGAVRFYRDKMGYHIDEDDPNSLEEQDVEYYHGTRKQEESSKKSSKSSDWIKEQSSGEESENEQNKDNQGVEPQQNFCYWILSKTLR